MVVASRHIPFAAIMNLEEVTLHISEFLKHDASNS